MFGRGLHTRILSAILGTIFATKHATHLFGTFETNLGCTFNHARDHVLRRLGTNVPFVGRYRVVT